MFKNRMFLAGLGIGIVIGALLLQLLQAGVHAEAGSGPGNRPVNRTSVAAGALSDKDYKAMQQEASRKGTALDAGNTSGKNKGTAGSVASRQGNPEAGAEENSGTNTEGEKSRSSIGSTAQPAAVGAESAGKANPAVVSGKRPNGQKTIIVRILPGTGLKDTAAQLARAGIIADPVAFAKACSGSSDRIRAGYFRFEGGESVKQVIGIITGQPLSPEQGEALLHAQNKPEQTRRIGTS